MKRIRFGIFNCKFLKGIKRWGNLLLRKSFKWRLQKELPYHHSKIIRNLSKTCWKILQLLLYTFFSLSNITNLPICKHNINGKFCRSSVLWGCLAALLLPCCHPIQYASLPLDLSSGDCALVLGSDRSSLYEYGSNLLRGSLWVNSFLFNGLVVCYKVPIGRLWLCPHSTRFIFEGETQLRHK